MQDLRSRGVTSNLDSVGRNIHQFGCTMLAACVTKCYRRIKLEPRIATLFVEFINQFPGNGFFVYLRGSIFPHVLSLSASKL